MIKHQPDLQRPETEIEKRLRELGKTPRRSEEDQYVQVFGFTKQSLSRLPATYVEMLRERAIHQREAAAQFTGRKGRRE